LRGADAQHHRREKNQQKKRADAKTIVPPSALFHSTDISHVEQHTKSLPDSAPLKSTALRKRDGHLGRPFCKRE